MPAVVFVYSYPVPYAHLCHTRMVHTIRVHVYGITICTYMVQIIAPYTTHVSLSTIVLNSRDRQGIYGMQHFRTPRNAPYNRL